MKYKIKKKRKTFKTWYIFVIFIAMLIFLSTSYALYSTELVIKGTVSGTQSQYSVTYLYFANTSSYPSTIGYMSTYTNTFAGSPTIKSVTMGGTVLTLNTDYTYTGGTLTIPNVTGDLVIEGNIEINYVNVTFDNEGTTNIVSVKSGNTVSKPSPNPEKHNYAFLGWFDENDVLFDFTTPITKDITLYAKWKEGRARINIRSMYRDLHDSLVTQNEDGTYTYGNINGKGVRIKSLIVAVRQATEIPSWAVGKNWNSNIGRNDTYEWLGGSNMGDSSTIYCLPILAWYDVQNRILYWYSEDNSPVVYYTEQYGKTCGCNSFSSVTDISGMQNWDFSEMDMLEGFFQGCSKLTDIEPIRYWNVSNVTNMKNAFREMSNLQDASPINDWEIGNVTNFQEMFKSTPGKPTFTKVTGTFSSNGTFEPN